MLRRVAALVFALAVLAAPVSAQLCEATCALHGATTASAEAQHSCHEAPPSSGSKLSAAPHFCGHTDGLPSSVEQAAHTVSPPAIIPVITFATLSLRFTPAAVPPIEHSPPGSVTLTTQLRV
jgi:hypothetical protein